MEAKHRRWTEEESRCPHRRDRRAPAQPRPRGLAVVDELTRDFLVPLLSEEEADRMVGWNWGVSL